MSDLTLRTWIESELRVKALAGKLQAEEGQGMVEYTVILALVAAVAITALTTMGANVTNTLGSITNSIRVGP